MVQMFLEYAVKTAIMPSNFEFFSTISHISPKRAG